MLFELDDSGPQATYLHMEVCAPYVTKVRMKDQNLGHATR